MNYDHIILEKKDGAAWVTLNRPQALNALAPDTHTQLQHAFLELDKDPSVRVVVITGAGRAFCAGGDLKYISAQKDNPRVIAAYGQQFHDTFYIMEHMSKVIIAMVNVPLLINVLEFDVETAALTSGYLLSGMTGAMAVMAWLGGQLTEKVSYRPVTAVGLAFCALGMGLMGWLWLVDTPYLNMASHLVVLGVGFGLVIAPIGTAVINAASEDQRGVASSLVIVLRLMGMSVGLSGLTAWGLYRFEILRKLIDLPTLPLSDPTYQRALADGLTEVTVSVLTETFLISAGVALLGLLAALRLQKD